MIKRSLILSLLILGNIIWIPCLKAQDSDSIVCLTTQRLDYLLLEQIDAHELRKDTTFKADKIKDQNRVILFQSRIIDNNNMLVNLKDTIISKQVSDYNLLSKKFIKQQKHLKFFKGTTLGLGIIVTGLFLLLTN